MTPWEHLVIRLPRGKDTESFGNWAGIVLRDCTFRPTIQFFLLKSQPLLDCQIYNYVDLFYFTE